MRVLITGVTGFIGNALARELVELGHDVYGLVRFISMHREVPEGVTKVVGDLTDYHSLVSIVESVRPEVVFHVGALTPVSLSYRQPRAYAEVNYIGTINLLEALRKHAFESIRLVAVAGTTEMFDTTEKIRDGVPFRPESPYAVSKVATTLYAEYMFRAYGLPVVTVIPTNTYGRANVRQSHYFIEKLIVSMLRGEEKICLGNPNAVRDWMFREDHVEAYLAVMRKVLDGNTEVLGQRFYFGTGEGHTTRETAELIKKLIGWGGELVWGVFRRPSETASIVVDYSKAKEVLGWEPRWDLVTGLKQAIMEWGEVLGI